MFPLTCWNDCLYNACCFRGIPKHLRCMSDDRKALGGERRAGSAKDLETGIELGSRERSCAVCRRTNCEAIGANDMTTCSRCIIFCLMRHRKKRRKLECATLFHAAISAGFKTHGGAYTSSILSFSAWLALRNNSSLFLQRLSACFLQKRLTCLHFTWCENVKRLSRNAIWIWFQSTYE